MTDSGIASIVRSLAEGVDPGRVLRDVAQEAMARTATSHVLLAVMLGGQLTPLVAIGAPHAVLLEAAREAEATGGPARRSDPALGLEALAVPVRHRYTPVAVLAVAGALRHGALAPAALAATADCAALALAARPPASLLRGAGDAGGGAALAEALAGVAAARSRREVVEAALDVAAARFGARSGFACLPTGPVPGGVEVVGCRGVDRERLGAATRHPGFTRLISGSAVAVVPPTDAAVAQLTAGAEFAVTLPAAIGADGGGPGALVLLVPEEPDPAGHRALEALQVSFAAGLRAARAAAAAEAGDARLAGLAHFVADPVLAVDDAGRFTVLNAAAAELFALSDSFEIGRPARGRLGHPALEALLLAGADSGPTGDGSEVVLGRPTPQRFVPAARSLPAGGRVLLLRPVRAASPAGRETDEAAAAFGRALRDPLAAITTLAATGSTALGQAGSGSGPVADWDAARAGILAAAARLEAIADQLALLSADGQAPTVTVRAEPLDAVALAATVVEQHRRSRPDRLLTVVGPPRLEVRADRRLLERVLDPLIDNALRYSEGPVTVEVADRGESFEVAVIDSGPGIFSGDIPGLFERYHPLDGSPVRQGSGISLFTCRRLAELMAGRLWCDSRLGVGSRFAVRLPTS